MFTVIIPCYNQAGYLREAVQSVLAQEGVATEVVVVDDGSTDDTAQVAGEFGEKVNYIYQENAGVSVARNTGWRAASGNLICFLDADDYLLPDMLRQHARQAALRPDAAVFYGGCVVVGPGGEEQMRIEPIPLPDYPLTQLLIINRFPICAVSVRRTALQTVQGFDLELRSCEDWDCWIRLAAAEHRFVRVPDAWAAYRRYPESKSSVPVRWMRAGLQLARKHRHLGRRGLRYRLATFCTPRCVRYYALQQTLMPQLGRSLWDGQWRDVVKHLRALGSDLGLLRFLLTEYWLMRLAATCFPTVRVEGRGNLPRSATAAARRARGGRA